jgi:hypothetical protein
MKIITEIIFQIFEAAAGPNPGKVRSSIFFTVRVKAPITKFPDYAVVPSNSFLPCKNHVLN